MWSLLYSMSVDKLKVLKVYIKTMVDKNFIQTSFSSVASGVLFAKKPDGNLHFCIDYWALHAIIIKNCYSLPLIEETLKRICKAKIFSQINIIAAFNKLHIKKEKK